MVGFIIVLPFFAVSIFCATLKETIEKEIPFKTNNRLKVENVNGNITVEEWDKNIVRFEVTKIVKVDTDEDAKKSMDKLRVEFSDNANEVSAIIRGEKSYSCLY